MVAKINAQLIHKRLDNTAQWEPPMYWGPEKYSFRHVFGNGSIIVSAFSDLDNVEWLHASITRKNSLPTYTDLKMLHKAVFDEGWSYQIFSPSKDHINLHEFALHLWGRADGQMVLPDFVALFKFITGVESI